LHRLDALVDDAGIFLVEEDANPIDPTSMAGDAAVSQVEAKQMNVVRMKVPELVVDSSASAAGDGESLTHWSRMPWELSGIPIANCPQGKAELACSSPRAQPVLIAEPQSLSDGVPVMHQAMTWGRCG
jgi:hypothetical protein